MLSESSRGLERSLDTFLKSGGARFVGADKALQNKIKLGKSKSGPCLACRINQKTGAKTPPLHANCKCAE